MNRLWAIHLLSLVSFAFWLAIDPMFVRMFHTRSIDDVSATFGWARYVGLAVLCLAGLASLLVIIGKLVGRLKSTRRQRSIRQLLAICTVVALWLSLIIHHQSVCWQGKRLRFIRQVDQFEAMIAPIRDHWPERDGEIAGIGPFMAYPFGRPTTLLLLQTPRIATKSVFVSAIEKDDQGTIRLQLTGADGGDWAEWHPNGNQPRSFVGGLSDPHQLQTASSLGQGWYLVRYHTPSDQYGS